ncbi:uncharacterized protein APUU_20751A [Aspergillus puulaauensis]|uniref:Uncharacterized protein n=1 Tax=Aspergillus puulaauensis TaxID=1220207 RepID=A0A7R8AI40_9EURO|nr:uncharacterized protein APUU_20751A [Aspergillus puulaauensis]BCS20319.1 hypothetical protein APUU_20751A [Aspergillus puulaauensis]
MKPSFILLPLSFMLPSVFAACKTNEKYCGEYLVSQFGYGEEQIVYAARQNTDLPSEATNDGTKEWEEIIFKCVDGEKIEALGYCDDPYVCTEDEDGTGAGCDDIFDD